GSTRLELLREAARAHLHLGPDATAVADAARQAHAHEVTAAGVPEQPQLAARAAQHEVGVAVAVEVTRRDAGSVAERRAAERGCGHVHPTYAEVADEAQAGGGQQGQVE